MPPSVRPITPRWAARGSEIPLEAKSEVATREWDEAALAGQGFADSDLFAIGLPAEDVTAGMEAWRPGYRKVREAQYALQSFRLGEERLGIVADPATDARVAAAVQEAQQNLDQVRRTALGRLRDWFAGRTLTVDDRQLVEVRVPLFVLAAAESLGCSATYKTTSERGRELGWTVHIAGTGMGGDATITSSVTSTFTAGAGQAVLVFLPVTVAIEQVRVTAADGATLGSGHRVNVSPARRKRPVPGALLIDHQAIPRPGRRLAETYLLAGYDPGRSASYEYDYEQARTSRLNIGVKAAGVELAVTGEATMTTAVTLTYVLVGGQDYRLYRTARDNGLVWA